MPGLGALCRVTVTIRILLLPEFIGANTTTGQLVFVRDRYVDG